MLFPFIHFNNNYLNSFLNRELNNFCAAHEFVISLANFYLCKFPFQSDSCKMVNLVSCDQNNIFINWIKSLFLIAFMDEKYAVENHKRKKKKNSSYKVVNVNTQNGIMCQMNFKWPQGTPCSRFVIHFRLKFILWQLWGTKYTFYVTFQPFVRLFSLVGRYQSPFPTIRNDTYLYCFLCGTTKNQIVTQRLYN